MFHLGNAGKVSSETTELITLDYLLETHGEVIFGGALIGLALAVLMILTGRVMSASGMIGNLKGGREGLAATSITFIAGVFIAPSVLMAFGYVPAPPIESSWPLLVAGGVLVGLAARIGKSSLIGAISGLAKRSGRAVLAILAILSGAALSSVLHQVLSIGGPA